ncbi:glyoxylate reductase/hydroxypyruvate reductase-like isoform X2 [Rhopilema esculentum]|uniref:glyoxylate reductase/hydroxypyruvate reductase-like isoform X2 n=1 Tax=Rhopilema esculentum TaxID=499914 RepID=UPI0031E14796
MVVVGTMQGSRILVARKLPDAAMDLLKESRHTIDIWPYSEVPIPRQTLLEKVSGIDGLLCLITDKIDSELLDAAGKQLKVVSTMSVGYDHVSVPELKKRGIILGNTPDVLTDATADLTVALLLATSRRLFEANKEARQGNSSWDTLWMCGPSLKNSVVGIVGLGRIGHAVAQRLVPFGIKKILYTGRKENESATKDLGAIYSSLDSLLQQSDFVIACCALNESTREMFNKDAFSKMKDTAIFINTSRGGVVNQEDLIEALKSKQIKAAGLDVTTPEPLATDHELFTLENCVVLPHIGSAEVQTRVDMAVLAVKNLLAALDGKDMPAKVV